MISLIVLSYEVDPTPTLDLAILDEPKLLVDVEERVLCPLCHLGPSRLMQQHLQYNTYVQSTPLRLANKAIYSSYFPIQCYGSVLNKEEKHLININPFLLFFYCLKQAEGGRYRY